MSTVIALLKDELGNQYPLYNKINTIGRANNCHIILKVSSVHFLDYTQIAPPKGLSAAPRQINSPR